MAFVLGLFLILAAGCSKFRGHEVSGAVESVAPVVAPAPAPVLTRSSSYIYRVAPGNDAIYRASVDLATGGLIEDTPTPLSSGANPSGLAVTPNHKFLFVALPGANHIDSYSLNSATGEPTFVSGHPTTGPATKLFVDPLGRYLLSLEGDWIVRYKIDAPSGALTWQGVTSNYGGYALALNSFGTRVYSSASGSGTRSHEINPANALISNTSPTHGALGPHVAVNKTDSLLYVCSLYGGISLYDLDAVTGALTYNRDLTMPQTTLYYGLTFNAAGTKAYALNYATPVVEAFTVDAVTGNLTLINSQTLSSGCLAKSLSLSNNEDFVFTGCTDSSGRTYSFKLGSSGELEAPVSSILTGLQTEKVLTVTF